VNTKRQENKVIQILTTILWMYASAEKFITKHLLTKQFYLKRKIIWALGPIQLKNDCLAIVEKTALTSKISQFKSPNTVVVMRLKNLLKNNHWRVQVHAQKVLLIALIAPLKKSLLGKFTMMKTIVMMIFSRWIWSHWLKSKLLLFKQITIYV